MNRKKSRKKSRLFSIVWLGLIGLGAVLLLNRINSSQVWTFASLPTEIATLPVSSRTSSVAPENPVATFVAVQQVPAGQFNYGGSSAWAPIRLSLDPAVRAARPELQLHYVIPVSTGADSKTGIQMMLDGTLTFAQSSQSLQSQDYRRAQQQGIQLKQIPVAIDGLAIAVHPSLNLPGLTLEQLRLIYSGKITNWQAVGGPDLAIVPYRNPDNDVLFAEMLLGGQDFIGIAKEFPTTTIALRELAKTPGGIYYASAPLIISQCSVKPLPIGRAVNQWVAPYQEPLVPTALCTRHRNQLNITAFKTGEYPVTRSLFVVVNQNGGLEERVGEAYANLLLSDQGQELLTKAGFVKIR